MAKFVIETVQTTVYKYYCECEDPVWALDSIAMGELDHYSSSSLSEDIISCTEVDQFPRAVTVVSPQSINAATYKFNYEHKEWEQITMWEIDL